MGSGDDDGSGSGVNPTCASSTSKADKVPLDLYVMLDQSSSMDEPVSGGGDKWDSVAAALNTFVQQPGLDGMSMGIQYFAVETAGNSCPLFCDANTPCGAGCGTCFIAFCSGATPPGDSCAADDYAKPEVEIAPLPAIGPQISTSIGKHGPTTGTPTSAALQGAINHAKDWGKTHAGDAVVAVLATDGEPSGCDDNLNDIDMIAASGLTGTPKVLTFVIGVGSSLSNLNGIAAAGGTQKAFLVDTGGNTNQQFLDAMNAIRHAALGCTYGIPLPVDGAPDYSSVNVVYTPGGGGSPITIPYVMDKASCPASGNAWYYDNPAAPMQIILCDAACGTIEADTMGEVDVTLGCATVIE
jgi:hypothetical protein